MQQVKLSFASDETRPVCRRCQKCGLQCTGAKDITFLEAKIVNSRRSDKRAIILPVSNAVYAGSAKPQMPISIPLIAFELDFYKCFMKKYLRPGGSIDLVLPEIQSSDTARAPACTAKEQMSHQAILSFAIVLFGSRHGQVSISQRGYTMLGITLKRLNQALSDRKCCQGDEVLLSVISLAMLECLVPTGPGNYLDHMLGLERLLSLRNPLMYCSPKTSTLYKGVRHMLLFASLRARRPSILAKAEWKKTLRANCSNEEIQEQDLYDVLADCTVLIAELDQMLAHGYPEVEAYPSQHDELKERALGLVAFIYAWKERWDKEIQISYANSLAPFVSVCSQEAFLKGDLARFLPVYEFPNDQASTMLMHYNTTLIYVLQVLASLESTISVIVGNDARHNASGCAEYGNHLRNGSLNRYISAERSAAVEVCRCIPSYLLRKSRSAAGPSPIFHWAVTTAWMTLRTNDSPERKWMMHLLRTDNGENIAGGLWTS